MSDSSGECESKVVYGRSRLLADFDRMSIRFIPALSEYDIYLTCSKIWRWQGELSALCGISWRLACRYRATSTDHFMFLKQIMTLYHMISVNSSCCALLQERIWLRWRIHLDSSLFMTLKQTAATPFYMCSHYYRYHDFYFSLSRLL